MTSRVATIVFTGFFEPAHFSDFIAHRAGRLDLQARLGELGPRRISVRVSGEADLIDAFELACSLGPLDCFVQDISRHDV